jgi:arylsulfatase A-like enzyme
LVSNVDIAPTIAELAGIQFPGSDGISLVPLLNKPVNLNRKGLLIHWAGEESFYVTPAFWGIIEPEWKYMELATGEKELYDRINDPLELNNVAGNPAYAAIQKQLQADLQALLIRSVYFPIFFY